MPRKNKHIHKYVRRKLKDSTVYACIIPGCTHYILPSLLEGRLAMCNRCIDKVFVITKAAAKLEKPHCDECYRETNFSRKDKKETLKNIEDILGELEI